VTSASAKGTRSLGRRDIDFGFDRVFIPSLVIDHTELVLRQAGVHGDEGFAVWAGTLAGGDAHVATLVIPRASGSPTHGTISADTSANVLTALDERDLVPIMQLHSHPRRAFLSEEDAIRPLVAVPGFISVIIPSFGFVDLADVGLWSGHEYGGADRWRELDHDERRRRFIIDDSVIRVD
jgi:proteasome lid subunit RPN8/RPN11